MINRLKNILRGRAQSGFTLIETLVAVLILAIAIAGPLTIASKGLQAALVSKDQVTAFYLAQDAVEYVRYKRDTACLTAGVSPCSNATWLGSGVNSLSLCTGATCYIDSRADTIVNVVPPGCSSNLRYNANNYYFTYISGASVTCSPYNRTVRIQTPLDGNADEANLTVSVSWIDTAGVTHAPVTVTETLFNWQ